MKTRKIARVVRGIPAVDGAGVKLTRVLGGPTIEDFDPFLMLDSFDSTNPPDYMRGFPMHPHRGIETITYLVDGELAHEDSLGNKGMITPGSSQWMTAGSGILHQEMPQEAKHFLGLQLWLNLPAAEKMTEPKYFDIRPEDMGIVEESCGRVIVISGEYGGVRGAKPHHIQATLLDVTLYEGQTIEIPVAEEKTVFIFSLLGDMIVDNEIFEQKTALLLRDGDTVEVSAVPGKAVRFILASAPALHEPVAWGGPIVMNTQEELRKAFSDLRAGTFIK
ncbi:MAG: pirin family protein [Anaerolineaceae bacterium]|nr:pirin family protein [Anaerolineaceae bacterium]MDD4042690.1 pirin family protein [Anaerolineaceae bacterium]